VLLSGLVAWSYWQYRLPGYDQVFIWPILGLAQGSLILAQDRAFFAQRAALNSLLLVIVAACDWTSPIAFVYQIIVSCAVMILPAMLVRRMTGGKLIDSYPDFLKFTVLTAAVAAVAALPTLVHAHRLSSVPWPVQWAFGLLDIMMNIFLFVPLYVCLVKDRQTREYFRSLKWIELLVVLAAMGVLSFYAYGVKEFVLSINFMLLPIYIFVAMRHGLFGSSMAIILMTLIALRAAYAEPIGYLHNATRMAEVNLMMVFGFINAFVMYSMAVIGRQGRLYQERLVAAQEAMAREQKRELVDRMAGGIAHDVNNLLMVVSGYSELLAAKVTDDAEARKCKEEVMWAVDRAKVLLSRVVQFGKDAPAHKETVRLVSLVDAFCALAKRMLGNEYRIVFRSDEEDDLVSVDRRQIEQVLLNLLVNAKDAMPGGGAITLSVCRERWRGEEHLVCVVRDTGSGIPDALKEKVFDAFYSTKKERGTGLGLATSRSIMQRHGGTLFARDATGGGAEFVMVFKGFEKEKTVAVAKKSVVVENVAAQGRHILVVDDNESVRETLAMMLEAKGFEVDQCSNGIDAIRMVADDPIRYAVIVCDIKMPGESGPGTIAKIRSFAPQVPCVFMTGWTDVDLHEITDQVLTKPFAAEDLYRAVVTAMAKGDV
jgi:signal transduction histidine kinase